MPATRRLPPPPAAARGRNRIIPGFIRHSVRGQPSAAGRQRELDRADAAYRSWKMPGRGPSSARSTVPGANMQKAPCGGACKAALSRWAPGRASTRAVARCRRRHQNAVRWQARPCGTGALRFRQARQQPHTRARPSRSQVPGATPLADAPAAPSASGGGFLPQPIRQIWARLLQRR